MALVICRAVESLMFWPITKNEAGTSNSSRMSSIWTVVVSLGPSSKLRATYLAGDSDAHEVRIKDRRSKMYLVMILLVLN